MGSKAWILTLAMVATATAAAVPGKETPKEMPVDSERQCRMFKRIFAYDKHLKDSENIVVLVVGQSNDGSDVAAVTAALRAAGMYPAAVTVDSLNEDLSATLSPQSTVVYVMPGIDYVAVNAFAESASFLSVSGLPSLAESGQVSVSVDMAEGRPQVVVNISRLTAEGHELSSELLRLARVIR